MDYSNPWLEIVIDLRSNLYLNAVIPSGITVKIPLVIQYIKYDRKLILMLMYTININNNKWTNRRHFDLN